MIDIYFAPVPGSHKVGDPDRIVIRRPAQYSKDGGSATAIKVEAFVRERGPMSQTWNGQTGEWEWSNISEPLERVKAFARSRPRS